MGFSADSILAFFFFDQYNIENAPEEREVTRMYDVTALGELLIDFTCESTDATGYPTMAAHPGGGPPNFLAALSKFGAKTALIAKVGTDAFGNLLKKTLLQLGIDNSAVISDDSVFTTLAFVTLDETGDREFSFARKPGSDTQLKFAEVDLSYIDNARAFHFSTLSLTDEPSRSTTYRVMEYARAKGKLIHFDPNLRKPLWKDLEDAKAQMLWGLAHADVVKISDEEAEFLFGLAPEESAAYILGHFPVKLVLVTCGPGGVIFANKQAFGHTPALPGIQVVDTTGAGDIFGGSTLWQLLRSGKQPQDLTEEELRGITKFACTAAGLSTMQQGGANSVPEMEEILARL